MRRRRLMRPPEPEMFCFTHDTYAIITRLLLKMPQCSFYEAAADVAMMMFVACRAPRREALPPSRRLKVSRTPPPRLCEDDIFDIEDVDECDKVCARERSFFHAAAVLSFEID